jgi:hypothetical protein
MTAIRDTQTSNVTRQQREPLSGRPRPTLFVSSLGRFLRLLADALASGGWLAFDQAIFKAESIQVFHGLSRSAQGLFLGLLEKCCALPVQFLNALDRCLVCHLAFPVRSACSIRRPLEWRDGVTGAFAD